MYIRRTSIVLINQVLYFVDTLEYLSDQPVPKVSLRLPTAPIDRLLNRLWALLSHLWCLYGCLVLQGLPWLALYCQKPLGDSQPCQECLLCSQGARKCPQNHRKTMYLCARHLFFPFWPAYCSKNDANNVLNIFYSNIHMSSTSSIVSLVSLLDGTNYHQWAIAMKAYLQVQELWSIVGGHKIAPKRPASLDNAIKNKQKTIYNTELAEYSTKYEAWTLKDEKTHSTILLCLNVTIQATHKVNTAR